MAKNKHNRSGSNSKDYTPRKLGWFDTLLKYRWPIAAVVAAVGVGLAITVATGGVGALVVAPVAGIAVASYAPETVAAITLAAIGGTGLLGFGINKAFKLSKSKSFGNDGKFTSNGFFKELLGTDEKTKNPEKLLRQNLSKRRDTAFSDEKEFNDLYTKVMRESEKKGDIIESVQESKNGGPSRIVYKVKSVDKFNLVISANLDSSR